MRRKRNWNDAPVMKAKCKTCPFGPNGDPHTRQAVLRLVASFRGSQRCHHPVLIGKPETHLCRGARDVQLNILHHMGVLDTPTDAAFTAKWKELQQR